jgi:hypothetical protein
LLGGCFPAERPTSRFAASEQVQTGDARYDEAFARASTLRSRVDASLSAPKLRRRLSDTLDLGASATPDALLAAVKERGEKARKGGARIFVVVAPNPKAVVRQGETEDASASELATAVEDAIRSSLERSAELEGLASEVASAERDLPTLRDELARAFPDASQRKQIDFELEEASRALEVARLRATTEAGRSVRFAIDLVAALDAGTDAELASLVSGDKACAKPKSWLGKLGKGGAAGKGGPAKPAKPKQDFDP